MTRKKFGRLTAIKPTNERTSDGSVIYLFECDCGNECYISLNVVKAPNSKTNSCGCLRREKSRERMKELNKLHKQTGHLKKIQETLEIYDGTIPYRLGVIQSNNKTGVSGVSFCSKSGKYRVRLQVRGVVKNSYHETLEEATKMRLELEKEHHDPIIDTYRRAARIGGKAR